MAEIAIRNAVRDGGEATIKVTPSYRAGRVDPEAFDLSVVWSDGKTESFKFANPE